MRRRAARGWRIRRHRSTQRTAALTCVPGSFGAVGRDRPAAWLVDGRQDLADRGVNVWELVKVFGLKPAEDTIGDPSKLEAALGQAEKLILRQLAGEKLPAFEGTS